jgi:hypothetical protein
MRAGDPRGAVMSSPPTVTINAASQIASHKKWGLNPPVAPSSQAGPAILHGSLIFGRVPQNNQAGADLMADAAAGATTLQISARTGGGVLANGAYSIEPQTAPWSDATVADLLSHEDVTITNVTGGAAPYTATLSAPLTKAHRSGSKLATHTVSDVQNAGYTISSVGHITGGTNQHVLEFITDAPTVEILARAANGNTYRLWVDGQRVTAGKQTIATGGGGQPVQNARGYFTVAFGSRALRRIRFESSDNAQPTAIVTAAGDSVLPPEDPSVRSLWVGDSFISPQPQSDGIAHHAAKLLGWDCVMTDQIGATGYAADGAHVSAADRINQQIAAKPDVIVCTLGLNDSATGLQAAATAYFTALKAALPDVVIYAVGPWSIGTGNGSGTQNGGSNTSKQTVAAAIRDACAATGAVHVDTMLGTGPGTPWVTGTGKVGNTAGNGNADVIVSADGTHPSDPDGVLFYAHRVAAGIAATWTP